MLMPTVVPCTKLLIRAGSSPWRCSRGQAVHYLAARPSGVVRTFSECSRA